MGGVELGGSQDMLGDTQISLQLQRSVLQARCANTLQRPCVGTAPARLRKRVSNAPPRPVWEIFDQAPESSCRAAATLSPAASVTLAS